MTYPFLNSESVSDSQVSGLKGEMHWGKSALSNLFRIAEIPVNRSSDKEVWLYLE